MLWKEEKVYKQIAKRGFEIKRSNRCLLALRKSEYVKRKPFKKPGCFKLKQQQ